MTDPEHEIQANEAPGMAGWLLAVTCISAAVLWSAAERAWRRVRGWV